MTKASAILCGMVMAGWVNPFPGRAQTAQEVLGKLRTAYDAMRDVQVTFTQKVTFAVAKVEQRTSGTLYFKKDHNYRVELEDQTIVTDGETVWSYSASSHQVLIDRFNPDDRSLTPERILTGAPSEYSAALLGREKAGGRDLFVVKLTPTSEQSSLKSMKLWIDDDQWLIRKVEMTDFGGTETTYSVSDIRIDAGLEDSRFTFQIPEGASVVDLR